MGWIFVAMWNQSMMWVVGFGMARGSRFRISAPVRDHGDVPKAAIPLFPKSVERSIAYRRLVSVGGDKVAATDFPPTSATASGHDEFEVSR
ncbi:hypothetical protein NKH41_24760 [Mesorhizobium sp. M1169]|uniref:hypothetical protein n=1 Tax=Mesorhizobium sp. M1169 TaxID=2957066 RepID=UPI0033363521